MTSRRFTASDYAWSSVVQAAAYRLMDEGGQSPLVLGDIADAIAHGRSVPQGDTRRAAFQIEGVNDPDRGAVLLAQEALKSLVKSKLVRQEEFGYVWVGGRNRFESHKVVVVLRSKEERDESDRQAKREAPFLGWNFVGLPKREFEPDSDEGKALLASFANGWNDNLPPILMYGDEIIDGRMRAAACEYLAARNDDPDLAFKWDWRRHTRQADLPKTINEPRLNMAHLELAYKANIAIPLSTATKKEIAKRLKLEGNSSAEIAEFFNMSDRHARRLTSGVAADTMSAATADTEKVDDEKLLSLLVGVARKKPGIGMRAAATLVRDKEKIKVADHRVQELMPQARSLVETEPPTTTTTLVPVKETPKIVRIRVVIERIMEDGEIVSETVLSEEEISEEEVAA